MYRVSIPYLRVTHSGFLGGCPFFTLVSIPYLRVTHAVIFTVPTAYTVFQSPIYGSRTSSPFCRVFLGMRFQSPIYGSRTTKHAKHTASTCSFNPLSTGHARKKPWIRPPCMRVSIPYLRVTHAIRSHVSPCWVVVSIPYLRVTHVGVWISLPYKTSFQSPIYGSRTTHHMFAYVRHEGFNPLSTGHAPPAPGEVSIRPLCFNPLSTGHARGSVQDDKEGY